MPDEQNPLAPTRFRTERYYYDGVRRVQEVITEALAVVVIGNPIPMEGEAEMTGEPELEEPGEPPPPTATIPWTGREYVYAPLSAAGAGPGHGGGASAVDDFIAQVDNAEAWVFMIQDVHGDVVALASETGAILARYAYDGFGRILLSEHDAAGTGPQGTQSIKATANRVGHKGLFFDRYDTPHGWTPGSGIDGLPPTLASPTTGPSTQAGSWASGGVKGLYYNRSRHFSPNLGRFVQRDPNATGLVLAASPAMHGQRVAIGLQHFDSEFHYTDGPNTHAAYGGGPTLCSDPMGLIGIIGGLSTGMNMADMASDALDQTYQAVSIMVRLHRMLQSVAIDQEFDSAWASDWGASDRDYSSSGATRQNAASLMWPASGRVVAGLNEDIDKLFAGHKQHGSADHYREMREATKRYLNNIRPRPKLGRDVHIDINAMMKDPSGNKIYDKGGRRMLPDVVIYDSKGKVLHAIEIAHSQNWYDLGNKIIRIRDAGRPHNPDFSPERIRTPGRFK